MERVLHQRSALFDRKVNAASTPEIFVASGSKSSEWIRKVTRSVVREEMKEIYRTRQIDVGSITSVSVTRSSRCCTLIVFRRCRLIRKRLLCLQKFAIVRTRKPFIGGKEVRILRGRPALAIGSVPTLLPDGPAYLSEVLVKPRPERKRRGVPSSKSTKKVRLSRRDEQEASLSEDQNVNPNARAFENDEVNSFVPIDLQALADSLHVPRLWTKLITLDLDVLVFATTRTRKEPFGIFHEKVMSFTLDQHNYIVARCYFNGREKKYGKISSLLEAKNIFQIVDSALLCACAMSKDAYEDIAQNLSDKMKSTLTPANDGVFSKNCPGVVTAKGGHLHSLCYLRKALLARNPSWRKNDSHIIGPTDFE
ncbi:hypothetical protein HPB51_027944 [Rhipicephalus microplus]|uniref:Uncharacterized protein n=1 Tax=Rhipicephalus microplus TaxID=6941 RepID=A0A9J6CYY0_RHIMP|nr:hypothetical protein HPB51_027944 [Rhipicephalus microplus]